MDEEAVLAVMQQFFANRQPPVASGTLAEQPVTALLRDSLDVEEFLLHLEEGLQSERVIDMKQFGPHSLEQSFGELAKGIARFLSES